MADLKELIDLSLLGVYDEEIKKYIGDQADTTSIHAIAKDSSVRKIYFYKEKPADVTAETAPAFTIDMTDIDTTIGTMASLETTEKTNLVGAINELYDAIDDIDYSGKADKVDGATEDNFAALDADGNLKDSGKKADDFDVAGAAAAVSGYGEGETAKTVKTVATELGDVSTITVETASGVKADSAVTAINRLETEIGNLETGAAVTIKTDVTTDGALKSYTIYQGGEDAAHKISVIDIPKDFLVKSGSVVKDPEGKEPGTYIELVINVKSGTATDEKIYINVADLCDAYTAEHDAAQVQLIISDTNEISATIVASSVTATELATDAVTEGKIAANAVTEGKIAANAVTEAKLAENAITATADAETGVITSTVLDDVVVGALNDAINALQEDDLVFASEAEIRKLFEVATP